MYRLIWIFLCSTSLFAQNAYKAEHYQSTDGLPSDAVFKTLKKDGMIYIATQKGLCMYDGYIFVNSTYVPNAVFDFTLKNDLIYGEESGVGLFEVSDIYSPKKIISKVNYFDDSPDNDHYKNLFKDSLGNIWCTDFHFLKYINPQQKKQKKFRLTQLNTQLDISVRYLETQDNILFASSHGFFVWNKKNDQLLKKNDQPFSDIIKTSGKILLLAKNGNLYEYNATNKNLSLFRKNTSLNSTRLINSFVDQEYLLMYDSEKIYRYYIDSGEVRVVYQTEDYINHVFYDVDTQLFWISTRKGLYKIIPDNGIISTINLPDQTKTPVTDIIEDENGTIWLIKNSRSLFEITKDKIQEIQIGDEQLNRLSFSEGKLLLSTNSGVFEKEKNGVFQKIITTNYLVKKAVFFEQKYWIMPEIGMLKVFDPTNLKEIPNYLNDSDELSKGNLFNDISVSGENQLWLASWMPRDFGISKYDPTQKTFIRISKLFENENKFVADYFNRAVGLRNGNVAFSSTGGFNIVSPQGEIVYSMNTRDNKIASDNLIGIGEDKNGNIWFGCAEGLYLYNLKENKPTRISKTEGLHSNNVTFGFWINKDNDLYVSNEQTLEKIKINKILDTELIEKLSVTAIKVNNNFIPIPANSLILKEKNAKQIEFFFSALNFIGKDKLNYRYRFNKEEWHDLGPEPKLSLINFPYGNYQITLEVGDNLGNWQKKNILFNLRIIPPFYKREWFYLIMLILVGAAIYGVNYYLVTHEKQKEELKKKILENENKMLRSQMNPHFIFNSLNSINSFIIQNKADEAEKYLTKFSKLMRNILDNSRKDTIPLVEELSTIKLYLDLECVRMENKFDYSIEISKDIDTESIKIPPLILQPFLENAIWHGINPKNGNGFIEISIKNSYNDENRLVIKIKDDGIGREANAKIRKNNGTHKSYGIDITKERLDLQKTGNKVEITDLYTEENTPSGTLVTLVININHD